MNIQKQVIRLASINAALTVSSLPEHIIKERESIISLLVKEELISVGKDGSFSFSSKENNSLYLESFSDFKS